MTINPDTKGKDTALDLTNLNNSNEDSLMTEAIEKLGKVNGTAHNNIKLITEPTDKNTPTSTVNEDSYTKGSLDNFNPEIYGGTPILGVNSTVIIGHGASNENAVKNMILHTLHVAEVKLSEKIKEALILKIDQQIKLLPNTDKILFSSDILESVFGKYKNRVSENPMASITSLMLIIAAFTCNLTQENIQKSIENVKIADIKKWSQENIGVSLFMKRKVLLTA